MTLYTGVASGVGHEMSELSKIFFLDVFELSQN